MLFLSCAKEGFPSGGPKDETPPKVLSTTPPNGSAAFDTREFTIMFDEYVQVKDADENILVSPPMKQKPEYQPKGRGIVVKIKDTLRTSTTYLFQFKGGIVDFNEGNPLESYEYVFSTGSTIDSMMLSGRVVDALTAQPSEEVVTVVAFAASQLENDTICADSVVAKQKPMYMTRCDKEGNFQLNHLRAGTYRLLALNDADKNLMLNNGEAVAFLDSMVASVRMPVKPDTARSESTRLDSANADHPLQDSASLDSLRIPSADTLRSPVDTLSTSPQLLLRLSLLKREAQRVTKAELAQSGHIVIATQRPLTQHFSIRYLDTSISSPLYAYRSDKGDTLHVWTATLCDSVVLQLRDTDLCDTLRLKFRKTQGKSPLRPLAKPLLRSRVLSTHPYYDTLRIAFAHPVKHLNDSIGSPCVEVFSFADSSRTPCPIILTDDCKVHGLNQAVIDSIINDSHGRLPSNFCDQYFPRGFMGAIIVFQGHAGEKYRFTIPREIVVDIYGNTNADSLVITTQYDKTESYGNIILHISADKAMGPLLVQLVTDKGEFLRQQSLTGSGTLKFQHLHAGTYGFRVVVDTDGDGQWTPGDYWQHRQPEEVIYFEKKLDLRENWDMEEKWDL